MDEQCLQDRQTSSVGAKWFFTSFKRKSYFIRNRKSSRELEEGKEKMPWNWARTTKALEKRHKNNLFSGSNDPYLPGYFSLIPPYSSTSAPWISNFIADVYWATAENFPLWLCAGSWFQRFDGETVISNAYVQMWIIGNNPESCFEWSSYLLLWIIEDVIIQSRNQGLNRIIVYVKTHTPLRISPYYEPAFVWFDNDRKKKANSIPKINITRWTTSCWWVEVDIQSEVAKTETFPRIY